MLRVPKLQIPDTLPGAGIESPIGNGDRDTGANEGRLDVCRHVIAALCIVPIQALALFVLGHNAVQRRAHVSAHILVEVFVERQRARRVLDEEIEQPRLVLLDFRDFLENMVGDEVAAAGAGG